MTSALTPEAVVDAFERIADRVQARTGCGRVVALQCAVDQYPTAYEKYIAAIEASDCPEGQDEA